MHNKIKDFLKTVVIVDTETTGTDMKNDEIVELAAGRYNGKTWLTQAELFKPSKPIPPEASAVHYISNKMVMGKSQFENELDMVCDMVFGEDSEFFVAHNSKFDHALIDASFKRAGDNRYTLNEKDWICTWRMSRALRGVEYQNYRYDQGGHALGVLRFALDLAVPDGMQAHRADTDVLTTGLLLEKFIEIIDNAGQLDHDKDIGQQLKDIVWGTIEIPTWPLGKHKGKNVRDIPNDYYFWAMDNIDILNPQNAKYDDDLFNTVAKVMEERL